jgi:hypothetical protein
LGEVKWDKVMTPGHVDRLRRARDLLSVKGFDTTQTTLACYSGAGFDRNLIELGRVDRHILLVDLATVYAA